VKKKEGERGIGGEERGGGGRLVQRYSNPLRERGGKKRGEKGGRKAKGLAFYYREEIGGRKRKTGYCAFQGPEKVRGKRGEGDRFELRGGGGKKGRRGLLAPLIIFGKWGRKRR